MHHRSPRARAARTSADPSIHTLAQRLGTRLLQLGAVAGAIVGTVAVIGTALRDGPAPRSASVVAAEDDTRAFLDERAAVHLRRLRQL